MAKPSQYLYVTVVSLLYSATPIRCSVSRSPESIEIPRMAYKNNRTVINNKYKRSVNDRSKACDMLISFDEPFWEIKDRNMTELIGIANNHVQKLNDVFFEQIFIDDYNDLYFRLARVQVCIQNNSVSKI